MVESSRRLELFAVRGWSGLGILLDQDRLETQVGWVVKELHHQAYALELSPRHASRVFDR